MHQKKPHDLQFSVIYSEFIYVEVLYLKSGSEHDTSTALFAVSQIIIFEYLIDLTKFTKFSTQTTHWTFGSWRSAI